MNWALPVATIGLLSVCTVAGCGGGGAEIAKAPGAGADRPVRIVDRSKPPHVRLPPGPPPSRLIVRDLQEGSGPAIPRKTNVRIRTNYVAVSYRTGRQYEVRWKPSGGFNIGFGKGIEIKGWEKGLSGMRVGGRRELIVPSALAYGDGAAVYVIDLLAVER